MKDSLLTMLRSQHTAPSGFRHAADTLSRLMAADVAKEVREEAVRVQTPLEEAQGCRQKDSIVLIPILRAGLALLPAFLQLFEDAQVGFFGIKRDEETAQPHLYYENLPSFALDPLVFLLDPMIATGGSALLALRRLTQRNVPPSRLRLVSVISCTEGVAAIRTHFPSLSIYTVAEDPRLNSKKFILPGLGDFGDRYFGTL